MTLNELDSYFNSILKKENYSADPSRNGIQIQNSAPSKKQIKKVAFAVDATLDTVNAAAECGADVLFVHHGLFWDNVETLTYIHYPRVAAFIKNDIALIGYHIPLDANEEVGNNFAIARACGMKSLKKFCPWRGMEIGVKGKLPSPVSAEELSERILSEVRRLSPAAKPNQILAFGKKKISTVGIVSGGAGGDHYWAWREGLDCYITGELGHGDFNPIKEEGMNVIAGGHYNTETFGVNALRERLFKEKGVEGIFLNFPTDL